MQFEWGKEYLKINCLHVDLSSEQEDNSDVDTGETEAEYIL